MVDSCIYASHPTKALSHSERGTIGHDMTVISNGHLLTCYGHF